jgi:hypothetical protein
MFSIDRNPGTTSLKLESPENVKSVACDNTVHRICGNWRHELFGCHIFQLITPIELYSVISKISFLVDNYILAGKWNVHKA